MNADLINGCFELVGAAALTLNVRRLHRDKVIRGVSWHSTVFFTTWGLWNLFYYPSLDQWFSFAGGVVITLVNLIWLSQIVWYANKAANRTATLDKLRHHGLQSEDQAVRQAAMKRIMTQVHHG